ncbi:MAG: hypothetical protein U0229_03930 [Anaeromyxobacter sp.]
MQKPTLRLAPVLLATTLLACATVAPRRTGPAAGEGTLLLYVQPLPADAARLSFSLGAVAAVRADGTVVPLELSVNDLSGRDARSQRLLARGHLPAGGYAGLLVQARSAAVQGDAGRSDLSVGEAVRLDAPFHVEAGRPIVRWAALELARALEGTVSFSPRFAVFEPPAPNPAAVAAVLTPGERRVVLFDRMRREVVAALGTDADPGGLALDARGQRVFVSLPRRDEVQVLDLQSGAELSRERLRPGDAPTDLLVTPDGASLVVACPGAASVAFLDPRGGLELARVRTGEEPGRLQLDRTGRLAYVPNARSASVTVLDLPNRAAVATYATEAEPVRVQVNRAATRLFILHRGVPHVTALSLPGGSPAARVYVGLAARAIFVEPRTDYLWVAAGDDDRLDLFDPFSLVPAGAVRLPDVPGDVALDDAQNTLLVALPARGAVAAVGLSSRQVLGLVDVAGEPARLVAGGERR